MTTQADAQRPLPSLDEPDTAPFWSSCSEHVLTYQCDPLTGAISGIPRLAGASGATLTTRQSAGEGVVYSFTMIRRHHNPYFRAKAPYIVALIDLDEGFRLMAEVVGSADSISVGQRVRVEWDDHEGVSLPQFRSLGEVNS